MKITVKSIDLMTGLKRTYRLVKQKHMLYVLCCVKITCDDNRITLIASDLETGVASKHTAVVDVPGICVVNGRHLFDVVKLLPDGCDVTMRLVDDQLILEALLNDRKIGKYKFASLNVDDYPTVDFANLPDDDFRLFDSHKFVDMIDRTKIALSYDDSRLALTTTMIDMVGNCWTIVTTDGFRLGLAKAVLTDHDDETVKSINISRFGILEMYRLLAGMSDDTRFRIYDGIMICTCGEMTIWSRLVDCAYPAYKQILPDHVHSVVVDRRMFIDVLNRVEVYTKNTPNGAIFDISNNTMRISADNSDIGCIEESVDVKLTDSNDARLCLNPRYLIDALTVMTDSVVSMMYGDGSSPISITSDDNSYRAIVMPMRVE